MKFSNEIKKVASSILPYEISLSRGGGYFVGVKKILCFCNDCISVSVNDSVITVCGENLKISKLVDGDLGFTGKILKVEWEYL